MFYKLIQRALPGWFPYNSLHVMQPMFTKKENQKIATKFGTIKQYTTDDPAPPRRFAVLKNHASVTGVLKEQQSFVVPWLPAVNSLFPGEKTFDWFMLGGDEPKNMANRNLVSKIFQGIPNLTEAVSSFVADVGAGIFLSETFDIGKTLKQIDIIRE
jgi:hypothetical protein